MPRREVDLHGFHPRDDAHELTAAIVDAVRNAAEAGASELTLIHGHGRHRPGLRPFANTNTGWLGMTVRSYLREERELRQWMFAKLDCSHNGSTTVRLRAGIRASGSFEETVGGEG